MPKCSEIGWVVSFSYSHWKDKIRKKKTIPFSENNYKMHTICLKILWKTVSSIFTFTLYIICDILIFEQMFVSLQNIK